MEEFYATRTIDADGKDLVVDAVRLATPSMKTGRRRLILVATWTTTSGLRVHTGPAQIGILRARHRRRLFAHSGGGRGGGGRGGGGRGGGFGADPSLEDMDDLFGGAPEDRSGFKNRRGGGRRTPYGGQDMQLGAGRVLVGRIG